MALPPGLLSSIIASAPDAILVLDADQRIALFNAAAELAFGCSAAEAVGQPLDLFIPARARTSHGDHVRAFAEGDVPQRTMGEAPDVAGLRADGSEFPAEVTIAQLECDGQRYCAAIVRDVGHRRQVEEAQLEGELLYRTLARNLPDTSVYLFDHDVRIILGTGADLDVIGLDRDALRGRTLREFLPPEACDLLEPLTRAALAGTPVATELPLRGRVFLVNLVPVRDGQGVVIAGMATSRDITARKQAEDKLRASERQLRAFFDGAMDALFIVDEAGRYLEVNGPACELLGRTRDEILRQQTGEPSLPSTLMQTERSRADLETSGHTRGEHHLRLKNGTERDLEFTAAANFLPGRHLAVVRDVTARKRAEEALQASESQLKGRAAELQALYDISLRLNKEVEAPEVLRLIVEQAVELLQGEAGAVFLLDPHDGTLAPAVFQGYDPGFAELRLAPGEGLAGRSFAERRTMTVEDYNQWPGRPVWYRDDPRFRAMVSVPLMSGHQALGVLNVAGRTSFDDHPLWLAELLAAQAAAALVRARLHAELQRRVRQLAALNAAGRAITSTLDLSSVLGVVLAEVTALLGTESAEVLLLDPASGELILAAAAGPGAEALTFVRVPPGSGIAGWAASHRQAALVENAQQDPRFYARLDHLTGHATRSLVAVPLLSGDEVVGVIEAVNKMGGPFERADLEMLEAMAASAAVAIVNARLYQAEREQFRRLEQSQAQLIQAEKLAALGRLVASLAHEVNNPLQGMRSSVELLLEFPLPESERLRYLQAIHEEIQRLGSLVSRVLDFARPLPLDRRPVPLGELLDQALALAQKRLQHGRVRVSREVSEDLPPVWVARDRLAQVFLNLIINASQAMPSGGELRITARREDTVLLVEFADEGPGIPEQDLTRIFEPFYSTKPDGTGLGLAVSHSIMHHHGGDLTVRNAPGGGAIFTVSLPLAAPDAGEAGRPS